MSPLSDAINEARKKKVNMRPEQLDAIRLRMQGRRAPENPDPDTQTWAQRFDNSFAPGNRTGGWDFFTGMTQNANRDAHNTVNLVNSQMRPGARLETPQAMGDRMGVPMMGMFDPINIATDPAVLASAGLLGIKPGMNFLKRMGQSMDNAMITKPVHLPTNEWLNPIEHTRRIRPVGLDVVGEDGMLTRGYAPPEQYGPGGVSQKQMRNLLIEKGILDVNDGVQGSFNTTGRVR